MTTEWHREHRMAQISMDRKILAAYRSRSRRGFVYFVEAEELPLVKIGFSEDPKRRLEQLKTSSPLKLSLAGVWSGWMCDEKYLHDRFESINYRREWFRREGALCRFLKEYGISGDGSLEINHWNEYLFCPVALEVEWLE